MSISVGNLSRVSNSLRTFTALTQLRQNSLRLFQQEQHISSGQQLLSVGDNPVAAEKIARLSKSLETQGQILANLQHADGYLSTSDSTVSEISDLLTDAARIASEQAGSFTSAEERSSQAVVVDGIIEQLMTVGNRKYQGVYIFGGRAVNQAPLSTSLGRVTNLGDWGNRQTLIDSQSTQTFSVTAAKVYGLRDEVSGGYADFDVQLASGVRLSELEGATGAGIRLGRIHVTEGATSFEVDFTGAETVDDLIARFNDAAATATSMLTLEINPADRTALRVTNPALSAIQVQEIGQGTTAADLGIKKSAAGSDIEGNDVRRRMTLTTELTDLSPAGVTLPDGVVITNGQRTATVTFTDAVTVQDVLNRLNASGVGIRASISDSVNGIEIENLVAGTPLVIGENGGDDAYTLGIRTLDESVSLSRLNGFRGIHPVDGNDIKITNANGISFEVDLSGASTIGDVINAINAASAATPGAGIIADTSSGGAGLSLTGPAGAGNITVEAVNMSPVAGELGIDKTGSDTLLEGDNVGQFYQSGVFSALYRLRDALVSNDSAGITAAGGQINVLQGQVAAMRGELGARSRSVNSRVDQTQQAVDATQILLSGLKDVDFAEAVTKFQQAQAALQASLLMGSQTLNLSLLDFLQ